MFCSLLCPQFRAVLNWGRAQARKRGEQVTPVNVRPKIANVRAFLRLLDMSFLILSGSAFAWPVVQLLKAVRFPFMAYEELSGEVAHLLDNQPRFDACCDLRCALLSTTHQCVARLCTLGQGQRGSGSGRAR